MNRACCSHYKAHPFYNPHLNRGSGVYDIAVITLQKPLSETSGREKSPLLPCPPPNFQPSMYKNATLVGLGLDKRKTKERIQQITEAKLDLLQFLFRYLPFITFIKDRCLFTLKNNFATLERLPKQNGKRDFFSISEKFLSKRISLVKIDILWLREPETLFMLTSIST